MLEDTNIISTPLINCIVNDVLVQLGERARLHFSGSTSDTRLEALLQFVNVIHASRAADGLAAGRRPICHNRRPG